MSETNPRKDNHDQASAHVTIEYRPAHLSPSRRLLAHRLVRRLVRRSLCEGGSLGVGEHLGVSLIDWSVHEFLSSDSFSLTPTSLSISVHLRLNILLLARVYILQYL